MKIAIAVQHDLILPNITSDDWLIKAELEKKGIQVDVISWNADNQDLSQYDSIFVSSTWNASIYHEKFVAWLKSCEKQGKKLINDGELLLLGLHKDDYLSLLKDEFGEQDSAQGSITPSRFIRPMDKIQSFTQVRKTLDGNLAWQGDLVIKPIISAVGRDTYLVTDNPELLARKTGKYCSFNDADELVHDLLDKKGSKGLIIQPFIKGVETGGEYQLVFIANQFSHAVVKGKGFGNRKSAEKRTIAAAGLPAGMFDFAQKIVQFYAKKFPHGMTRARLDFFVGQQGPVLCEAEVVEPHTNIRYFSNTEQKTILEKYAAALIKRTLELKLLALLGEEAKTYFPLLTNPQLLKAVKKLIDNNDKILSSLADTKEKYDLAKSYSPNYIRECLIALSDFSERDDQNNELLLNGLNDAKEGYIETVLGNDRSTLSMIVRYLLASVVNFIAGLTFGFAHYQHYKNTGTIGFYTQTNSEHQLREGHRELEYDLEPSFVL